MIGEEFRLPYHECLKLLAERIGEAAPGRIQLLCGPRQVGKTTLLLELERRNPRRAIYATADGPEAALPGFWERLWMRVEETVIREGRALLLLDEVHLLSDWPARLKGEWDRLRRLQRQVHVVATGSSALRLAAGSPAVSSGSPSPTGRPRRCSPPSGCRRATPPTCL
jgi:predicted AAA+ superfamily ATPase